jgi:hypothetical protein
MGRPAAQAGTAGASLLNEGAALLNEGEIVLASTHHGHAVVRARHSIGGDAAGGDVAEEVRCV